MYFTGRINNSLYFSRSKDTLIRNGAVGISPVFYKGELPISITVHRNNGNPYMEVSLLGGNK